MSLILRWWSFVALCAFPVCAFAAATVSPLPNVTVTTRGQSVVIYGSGFSGPVGALLRTGKEKEQDKGIPLDAVLAANPGAPPAPALSTLTTTPAPAATQTPAQTITIKLPTDQTLATGNYLIFLTQGDQQIPVPGALSILSDDLGKITLESISPTTVYPIKTDYKPKSDPNPKKDPAQKDGPEIKDKQNFNFDISGQNLALRANDNIVISSNTGALEAGTDEQCDKWHESGRYEKICLSYGSGLAGQRLSVSGYHPELYEGPVSFQVRVGKNTSNAIRVTFTGIRAKDLRFSAIALFLLLAGVTFSLVLRGVRLNSLAGEKTGPLAAFFLDRQTNTFSLSKLQLLAWTSVTVFGYVYLFLCRNYVQWNASLPPLPDNLPTLLGISAGTTVAAIGITVNRGSKGSGPLHPSLADFISNGGLVAGERFQFFIWTLVGCMGFVGAFLHADPAALTSLPTIDGNLLTLMGISSAGYLAGKIVRKPGPIIELITILEVVPAAAPDPGVIKIEVKGQNLSLDAVVKVDQDELGMKQFLIAGIDKQDPASGTAFYSKVLVTLLDAERYRTGSHLLYLVNGDGQSACEAFPLNPLTLDKDQTITSINASTEVKVKGTNFVSGLAGTWTPQNRPTVTIAAADIAFVDQDNLTIKIVPGLPGCGKLVLESITHLLASANISVQAPGNAPALSAGQKFDTNTATTSVKVKGANFVDKLTGTWTPQGGPAQALAVADITREDRSNLTIKLIPGAAGTGRLEIETEDHLIAATNIIVK